MMITSVQNALIKKTLGLREPKERKALGLTLIDGSREITRAHQAKVELKHIFFCPKLLRESMDLDGFPGVEIIEVSESVFEKLAYGQRFDGVMAVAHIKLKTLGDLKLSKSPVVVVLESIEKPGNLGAILRTCDGVGVEAILICDGRTDIYNPNVIRASTGMVFTLPVVTANKEDVLTFLKQKGLKILGTFPDAKTIYTQTDLKGPLAFVLGTEDEGLSDFWTTNCAQKVKIPMQGRADSLNVSVSAAIVLYEALRQRTATTSGVVKVKGK